VRWRIARASVPGTSHTEQGLSCQDRCRGGVATTACGTRLLITVAADGAGSAEFGGDGAHLAVTTVTHWCKTTLLQRPPLLDESVGFECLRAVRQRLLLFASEEGLAPRELACTLLVAIVAPGAALLAQIGDGGIVVECDGQFSIPLWPQEGEFANSTYFATDDDADSHWRVVRLDKSVQGVAMFTDGIQRLALDFARHGVHTPFFEPLFAGLRGATDDDSSTLDEAMRQMLDSSAINERTDDDKTLVLAALRP